MPAEQPHCRSSVWISDGTSYYMVKKASVLRRDQPLRKRPDHLSGTTIAHKHSREPAATANQPSSPKQQRIFWVCSSVVSRQVSLLGSILTLLKTAALTGVSVSKLGGSSYGLQMESLRRNSLLKIAQLFHEFPVGRWHSSESVDSGRKPAKWGHCQDAGPCCPR